MPTDQPSIEDRLEALETTNRRLLRVVSLVPLMIFACAAFLGLIIVQSQGLFTAHAETDETTLPALQARSLDIVNADGEIVVHLGVRDSGAGGFWITDAEGRRMLKLNQTSGGTGRIAILDSSGQEIRVLAGE